MSASLVGSEMCIRDRARPAQVRKHLFKHYIKSLDAESVAIGKERNCLLYTSELPTICSV
eukprot:2827110-Alexandrium_andersonii.AAC.1